MPRQNYIQLRPSGYYYRQRVPDVLQAILGKTEIVASLFTRCGRTASVRAAYLHITVNDYLQALRPMPHQDLSHEQAAQIADRWKRNALNQDFDQRLSGRSPVSSLDEIQRRLHHSLHDLHRVNLSPYTSTLKGVIDEHRLDLEADAQRRLGYYLLKAQTEYLAEVQKRSDPDRPHPMSYISPDTEETEVPKNWVRLSEAVERWASVEGRRALTVKEWRYRINRFIEFKGDPYVHEITSNDIYDFMEAYEQLPNRMPKSDRRRPLPELVKRYEGLDVERLSAQSINNAITSVSSVLTWCVEKRILKENVARGIRVAKQKLNHGRRLPFKPEDLRAIFEESLVYRRGERPRGGGGHAAYWIPVLALFTGARLEELGQLALSDVRTEAGITFLEIEDIHDGQSVKNAASRRRTPLHRYILELGFMDYVDETRKHGHGDLFPYVTSQTGKRTSPFSKWVNRYFRKHCGIDDPRKVFHSFRHTFKDACREAEVPREVRNALMGHSTIGVDEEYGEGYSLRVLNEAIQKVDYNRLNINPWRRSSVSDITSAQRGRRLN